MTQHTTRAHAKRSPSAAYRWMNCPGSIRMSEGVPEQKSSVFADEGTAAHMLAEHCLRNWHDTDPSQFLGRVIDIHGDSFATQFLAKGAPLQDGRFEVDEEMVDGVTMFVKAVIDCLMAKPGRELRVEHRVNFGGDDDFGTADAMVYDTETHELFVFDLKYGSGKLVEVKGEDGHPNPQLVCYGEGGARAFDTISALIVTIVQPRMPHPDGQVRDVEIGPLELLDWSVEIQAALDATEDPHAPLVPGSWCDWCPAAAICPAHAAKALAVAQADFEDLSDGNIVLPDPEQLTIAEVAGILDGLSMLEGWAKAVRAYAYAVAESGTVVPGHKLVDKIARRKWLDEDAAEAIALAMGCDSAALHTEPKLKSPAQIEKLVGKKDFAAKLSSLAPALSSGTTLAPNSDRRPAVTLQIEEQFDDLIDDA